MVMGALNKLVTQTHWGHLDILGNLANLLGPTNSNIILKLNILRKNRSSRIKILK